MFWSPLACRRICKVLYLGTKLEIYYSHGRFLQNVSTQSTTLFRSECIENSRKEFFLQTLFERTKLLDWGLQAWSVLNNHYHFIAQAPQDAGTLEKLIRQLHSITAIEFNRRDNTPGRQVWFNYWDSCLTYEKSYLARLHYVHMNPVKHGLSHNAMDYPFCSYKWFVEQGDEVLKQRVFSQPIDRVRIIDDF